ncbi:MAG: DUF3189 family protein [Deltaproteobacteria bacterium]
MKVIFLGTTGVHHALVAANLYITNDIPHDPSRLPDFADQQKDHDGSPIFVGRDEKGNEVYSLGAGRDVLMAKKSIEELIGVLGFYPQDLLVKPIKVRGDIFFPFINKVSTVTSSKGIGKAVARYLASVEMDSIAAQVQGFKDHYQLH